MSVSSWIVGDVIDDVLGVGPDQLNKEIADDIFGNNPSEAGPGVPLGQLFLPKKEDAGPEPEPVSFMEPVGNEGVQMLDSWAWTQKLMDGRQQQAAIDQDALIAADQAKSLADTKAEIQDLNKKQLFTVAAFAAILLLVIL